MAVHVFVPGETVTAALLNTALPGAALAYTPTLLTPGANSNVSASGRYLRAGNLVTYWFAVTAVGAFTAGSGVYSISLPVPANPGVGGTVGVARLYDSSTGNAYVARVGIASTTLGMQYPVTFGGTLTNVDYLSPWTWAVGDVIDGCITYEAA